MVEQHAVEPRIAVGVSDQEFDDRLGQYQRQQRTIQGSRFLRRIKAEKKAFLGLIFVAILGFVAVAGPWLAPHGPDNTDFGVLEAPSRQHLMGTDSYGHDLFSRIILGTRVSFTVGIVGALLSMVVGVTMGLLAGYYLGWIDMVLMRLVDLIWAFPAIILAMGLVAVYGAGVRNVILAIALANMVAFSRIVRGQILSLREADFTLAARAIGVRDWRIMLRHLLPNVAAPIIVQTTLTVGFGILTETGLTFLGLGVDATTPTWGQALNESRNFISQAWWLAMFPGIAIGFTVLSLNLFGDGLRDALDVRSVGDR